MTGPVDVVVLGIVPWSARWHRPHHLAAQWAAAGGRVAFVTPHLLTDGGWRMLADDSTPRGVDLVQLGTHEVDTVHSDREWSEQDAAHCHHLLWEALRALGMRDPVVVVQTPGWWPVVRVLRSSSRVPVVYDCMDEHTGWGDAAAERVRADEDALAGAADLVLATAAPLAERLRPVAGEVLVVPNGCDPEHFAPMATPNGVLREPLGSGRPVVGYYGAIGHAWFDVELMCALADLRPDWDVVVVGPADEEAAAMLDASPNVLRLGEVAYADLPRYAADFDVAVVPFRVNELTAATDPVKLYELFAAGKPVVMTPMPVVYGHQGLLTVAADALEMAAAVDRFLADAGDREARRAIAAAASWRSRAQAVLSRMAALRESAGSSEAFVSVEAAGSAGAAGGAPSTARRERPAVDPVVATALERRRARWGR